MIRVLSAALLAFAATSVSSAQTTLLDFDGVSVDDLRTDYGDAVSGPGTGGYTYQGTGGYTPQVNLTFASRDGGVARVLAPWTSGYNDLTGVVYGLLAGQANVASEMVITLAADEGHLATLRSFDLGNYGQSVVLPYVRVEDHLGAVLFEELDVVLEDSTSPNERNFDFAAPLSAPTLVVRISTQGLAGNADNVGLDNLEFGQLVDGSFDAGTGYCAAAPNSTLGASIMRAYGSNSASANDLSLVATGLPLSSFALFVAARAQAFVPNPGGSAGNLCLGGGLGRFIGPGEIKNSIETGSVRLDLDLTAIPTPTSFVAVQAGETWNFQAWHRDGGTSNFTRAVAVTFAQ